MTLTIGSLCTGFGGLDMAVDAVFGLVRQAWVADPGSALDAEGRWDYGPVKFLAHRMPGVPNLGDITKVDWTRVEPVDLVCAGFPCTDVSLAGKQAGMRAGTRSGLWSTGVVPAIAALQPAMVVIENVKGLRSANADCDLEPCPWCLGNKLERSLRALGAVLGDLANLGFDASWVSVRASDVGAPHQRERVFVVARAADAPSVGHGHTRTAGVGGVPAAAVAGGARADGLSLLPTPTTQNSHGNHVNNRGDLLLPGVVALLPTPTATPYGNNQSPATGAAVRPSLDSLAHADRWGEYGAAIHRWEHVTGRRAPDPTEPGKNGRRLAARFVEWLLGLADGWVCDVPGLTRNQLLRMLGNGVVWQQGAYGIRLALDLLDSQAVA